MQTHKVDLVQNANTAKGIPVVIDVFRASNTTISLLERGVERIYAATSVAHAEELVRQHPGAILIGEQDGKKIDGADYDNSPAQINALDDIAGREAVLLTSQGSVAVANAMSAPERYEDARVLVASFANAAAIIDYLEQSGAQDVTIIACGRQGIRAIEDWSCATYLEATLHGVDLSYEQIARDIMAGPGAHRLVARDQAADLPICLELDRTDTVPEAYTEGNNVVIQRAT